LLTSFTRAHAGGFVYINGVLTLDNMAVVESTTFFMSWRNKMSWKYPFEEVRVGWSG
jgi:hypothetical protein